VSSASSAKYVSSTASAKPAHSMIAAWRPAAQSVIGQSEKIVLCIVVCIFIITTIIIIIIIIPSFVVFISTHEFYLLSILLISLTGNRASSCVVLVAACQVKPRHPVFQFHFMESMMYDV